MVADRESLLEAVRSAVTAAGGVRITRQQFIASSGLKLSDLFRHFSKWSDALTAAGFSFNGYNERIEPEELLADWAVLVRKLQRIPTRNEYKLEGDYSTGVFDRNFGSWSAIPDTFRTFATDQPEWADVVALLPIQQATPAVVGGARLPQTQELRSPLARQRRLSDRPTYGDPIDFRGLRHAPVNEDGVIFLFGMVARELGYLVESVQGGFPDCEAKRQLAPGQWQRVRIEFEFESRNFRDHGHAPDGCDIIVCWSHNWSECPAHLEVVELMRVIGQLADTGE
ncbi:MAG: hypothetical protein SH850_07000 [Planctomycetaceae bacterium]|nr:hypothetical protein [Planctomycetaceae bacterium]